MSRRFFVYRFARITPLLLVAGLHTRVSLASAQAVADPQFGFIASNADKHADAKNQRASSFDARAFRDSVNRITDRNTLRDIETRNAQTKSATGFVAAGFAALRIYDLTHLQDDAKKARIHFEAAHTRDKNDPWPLYGWALATLALVGEPGNTGRFGFAGDDHLMDDLGLDPRSRARRAIEKAVALDPEMTEAAQLLATLAVETHDADAAAQADSALQKLVDTRPNDPAPLLALAKAANAGGDLEKTARAAKGAAALSTGADASAAHHLAARALLRMNGRETEGAKEYFDGLRNLTQAEANRYYDELRGIATMSEMAELHTLPLVRAQSWIQTFWDMHAALSAVTVAHRLASHFQRLPYAEEFFMRRQRYGAPSRNALLLERPESPFDDRGYVFLRHGKPDEVINSFKTQTWVYLHEGTKPLMFHFADGQTEGVAGSSDWYLMYNLPCDPDFMLSRAQYDRQFGKLIYRCDSLTLREVSANVRRDVNAGLREDVDPVGFTQPLAAAYDIYTFRGEHAWTDIVTTIGVQAARLKPQTMTNGELIYSVNESIIVVDTATRAVARRDTVVQARAFQTANRGSIVLSDLQVSAQPSDGDVERVVVSDAYAPSRGQLYGGPLKVQDYSGNNLMMSDVVLAAPVAGGDFKRGDVSLTLVPWQAFPRGAFRVYYELYNVSPGNPYSTELRIESAHKGVSGAVTGLFGRNPAVSLKFDDVAPVTDTTIPQIRDAQATLEPGDYVLTITVTDRRTGQKVARARPVSITR